MTKPGEYEMTCSKEVTAFSESKENMFGHKHFLLGPMDSHALVIQGNLNSRY